MGHGGRLYYRGPKSPTKGGATVTFDRESLKALLTATSLHFGGIFNNSPFFIGKWATLME